MHMGKASEDVRFLDDIDLAFSLDSRSSSSQQMVNMEISVQPITFRASYRDINLISNIANKAVELYGISAKSRPAHALQSNSETDQDISQSHKSSGLILRSKKSSKSVGRAHLLTTKEQVYLSASLCVFLIPSYHSCKARLADFELSS
jgi:vacuolar protein sorting-associated protein 13A/C